MANILAALDKKTYRQSKIFHQLISATSFSNSDFQQEFTLK